MLLTYFKQNINLKTIFDPWKNSTRNESHLSYSGKCQNSRLFSGVICQIAWRADGSCFTATSPLLSAITGDHQMKNINDQREWEIWKGKWRKRKYQRCRTENRPVELINTEIKTEHVLLHTMHFPNCSQHMLCPDTLAH